MTKYFHGGVAGLKPGDVIEPNFGHEAWKHDGCPMCESGSDDSHQPDRVFITTDREYARFYASRVVRGDVYTVEPVGELERSTNDPGMNAWSVPKARVLTVYERYVELTHKQRWAVFKRMGLAEGKSVPQLRSEYALLYQNARLLAAETMRRRKERATTS